MIKNWNQKNIGIHTKIIINFYLQTTPFTHVVLPINALSHRYSSSSLILPYLPIDKKDAICVGARRQPVLRYVDSRL